MDLLEAIILGIIQGLTEFLPVSSSGHLELAKAILGDTSVPEESLTFTVVLHFATALSTLVIFRKEVAEIFKGLFQFKWNEEMKFSLKIILSMIPAVIIGLLFEEQLESFFGGKVLFVVIMLLVTAVLLLFADKAKNTNKEVSFTNSVIIGVSQAIALIPGTSRSGITMTAALMLGLTREAAARFSFLLSIPVIFLAGGLETVKLIKAEQATDWFALTAGAIFSAISAYICIFLFLKLLERIGMWPFVIYRLVLGAMLLFIFS